MTETGCAPAGIVRLRHLARALAIATLAASGFGLLAGAGADTLADTVVPALQPLLPVGAGSTVGCA